MVVIVISALMHHKHKTLDSLILICKIIALYSISEFMIRLGIITSLYQIRTMNVYIIGINFISIFNNAAIGVLFNVLYMQAYQNNIKVFINFKYYHQKLYKFTNAVSFVVGVLFLDLLESSLFRLPRSQFEKIEPYHNSLVRM